MLSFIKRNKTTLISVYFTVSVIAILLVLLLPWWPHYQLLIIPKYLLLFAPRWWVIILLLGLLFLWKNLSKFQKLLLPILTIVSMSYLDFQFNFLKLGDKANSNLSILSLNMGGGSKANKIEAIIFENEPDILLLQEAAKVNLAKLVPNEYQTQCISGLCIASKLNFEVVHTLPRKLFGGWGDFAIFYKVFYKGKELYIANIHLETPRTVLMNTIYRDFDVKVATSIDDKRYLQAKLITLWLETKTHSLIVGDFNMPIDENIYQEKFSYFGNAISDYGVGFNSTKKTRWHGVRIDHILYDTKFSVHSAEVLNSLGGDHLPLIARLNIKE